ncbi:M23 family metallopeptidase [Niabella beijingensis]|uniref:M23 family metallopeptidase n=1 Tax=Niabella beijingensis TaxID=2872700 RepID=UPI001CBBAD49|nr:peptidoglycan DD-metalloendopeptidase family protein [Niabella beijingensis]MBZ4189681.1 M23 family metallopeptidase [Niabella beijingensis]
MAKFFFLSVLLLTGAVSQAQLYKKPAYPQQYFRWPTLLNPDIVANMGELRSNHWHMGLDVRTNQKVNQQVVAAADGYIAFVGIEPLSWGRWIIINHPNGLSTLYGHLNDFRPDLEAYVKNYQYQEESWETHLTIPPGKFPVKKGDFISYSGTTGGSQGPHVHWEVIDTKSGRRLNPALFGTPFSDAYAPTLVKLVMYDRNNSSYDQYPGTFPLHKSGETYSVPGGMINTAYNHLSFAIQAYDTWNRAGNRDGIYSARLFFDGEELSAFYIDSIGYNSTRYMNCQVDYKMKANGGAWVQHISKLPGDRGGVYYDLGWNNNTIKLNDTSTHEVSILVSDTHGNTSTLSFRLQNNGAAPPAVKSYEWLPNRLSRIFKYDFEAYLPMFVLYDKMNPGYARLSSSGGGSVSARHKLGETNIPVHSDFEVRIKPEKPIAPELRDRVVIKRTGSNSTVKKASWNGDWVTALFRDFGTFEVFTDNIPPSINSLGSGDVVDLSRASRIAFTPTDNSGIADFRAEIDGRWIRFTNDKGRTYLYYFDEKVTPGEHTLFVTVTDIAGNKTERSWKFRRGGGAAAATPVKKASSGKQTVTKKTTASRSKTAVKASGKKPTSGSRKKK